MSANRHPAEAVKVVYQDKENVYGKMIHKPSGTAVNVQVCRSSKVVIQGSRTALSSIENKISKEPKAVKKVERKSSSDGFTHLQPICKYHTSSKEHVHNLFEPGTGRLLENIKNNDPRAKSTNTCINNNCPHKRQTRTCSGHHTASSQPVIPVQYSHVSTFHASAVPSSTHNYNSLRPEQPKHEYRSHSASSFQYRPNDGKKLMQCKNVTIRSSSCSGPTYGCECGGRTGSAHLDDEVFVDANSDYVGKAHAPFANQKAICYLKPAQPQQPPSKENQPAKKTLAQRLCQTKPSLSGLPTFNTFHTEYLDDYYKYKISKEHKYILRPDFISSKDVTNRSIIVDWLHQVQQKMDFGECLYLTTVKVLDRTLARIKIGPERYHLLAISSLWIVLKYHDSYNYRYAHEILNMLNGKEYSVKELLQLERGVLESINYNLVVHEPVEYAYYWIHKLGLLYDEDELVIYGVLYSLETISYYPEYSCNLPSLLALGAIYLALTIIRPHYLGIFHLYVKYYYSKQTIQKAAQLLKSRVLLAAHPQSVCRTALIKYSTNKMKQVSQYFNN